MSHYYNSLIGCQFCTDIDDPQRMNIPDFGDHLTTTTMERLRDDISSAFIWSKFNLIRTIFTY